GGDPLHRVAAGLELEATEAGRHEGHGRGRRDIRRLRSDEPAEPDPVASTAGEPEPKGRSGGPRREVQGGRLGAGACRATERPAALDGDQGAIQRGLRRHVNAHEELEEPWRYRHRKPAWRLESDLAEALEVVAEEM